MVVQMILRILLVIMLAISAFLLVATLIMIFIRRCRKLLHHLAVPVAAIGSLAAVIGVLLLKCDIDLKNRPFVYAETKIINNSGNTFNCASSIKNCGNTPAYIVFMDSNLYINGVEKLKPPKETGVFSLYPNSIQYIDFPITFNSGDDIEFSIDIDYEDFIGNKFNYSGVSKFWDMGAGYYSWKTISSK